MFYNHLKKHNMNIRNSFLNISGSIQGIQHFDSVPQWRCYWHRSAPSDSPPWKGKAVTNRCTSKLPSHHPATFIFHPSCLPFLKVFPPLCLTGNFGTPPNQRLPPIRALASWAHLMASRAPGNTGTAATVSSIRSPSGFVRSHRWDTEGNHRTTGRGTYFMIPNRLKVQGGPYYSYTWGSYKL